MKFCKTYTKSALITALIIFISGLVFLLVFPKEARNGGTNGAYLCIQVLIPSLFPFMVLSDFSVKSGLVSYIPNFVSRITGFLFNLPKEAAAVVILCLMGGYPVGAKAIKCLYDEGYLSKAQASRMCLFSVASGPGFLVTYIGAVMTKNLKLGYFLTLAQTITVLLLGVLSRLFAEGEKRLNKSGIKCLKPFGEALILSVESAVKSTAGLCGLVVLFSAFCEIFLTLTSPFPQLAPLVAFFEITTGVKIICRNPNPLLLAFFSGFGGLSVHLQIFLSVKNLKIPKLNFYLFRFLQGLLTSLITFLLFKIFPDVKAVFSSVECAEPKFHSSVLGCLMLIVTSGLFLVILQKQNFKRKHFRR